MQTNVINMIANFSEPNFIIMLISNIATCFAPFELLWLKIHNKMLIIIIIITIIIIIDN